ncbi:hypothetical protein DFH11DRAFT_961501 [Phellopilus nigrolimitatus]|nr:hypothetical protein DFH11DRAFT_961501 [Phellopilus nigrolimitatus]
MVLLRRMVRNHLRGGALRDLESGSSVLDSRRRWCTRTECFRCLTVYLQSPVASGPCACGVFDSRVRAGIAWARKAGPCESSLAVSQVVLLAHESRRGARSYLAYQSAPLLVLRFREEAARVGGLRVPRRDPGSSVAPSRSASACSKALAHLKWPGSTSAPWV